MNKRSPKQQRKVISILALSRRLLVAAAFVQLLLLVPDSIISAQKAFNFVMFASAAFGIVGFLLAYNQLNIKEEALHDSSAIDFFGPNLKGAGILMFCLAFFVPLLNMVIIIWTYFKVRSAVRLLA